MGMAGNERTIQELIAEGNDEQAVRLIDALLDLVPARIDERIRLLMQLGRRYMVLALLKGDGTVGEDVEALLAHLLEQRRTCQLASNGQRDAIAFNWYANAGKLFSAVLEQARSLQSKGIAATHRSFVYAACGEYKLALADLDLALSFVPLSPDFSYWRGMIFVQQGDQEAARAALGAACKYDPENELYHRAYARVMRGCDM